MHVKIYTSMSHGFVDYMAEVSNIFHKTHVLEFPKYSSYMHVVDPHNHLFHSFDQFSLVY